MKEKTKWPRVIYIIGVIALIIGVLDPLEGSVIIISGSTLVALSTYLSNDRHWKIFAASFIMIALGVGFMFYLSSLGGFGKNAQLSWWWAILILPYPIGWLTAIVLLIARTVKKKEIKS
jgi:hypothetical protein